MGFGYLLLGYLTAFLLELTLNADPINAGPLALVVGYGLMAVGIAKLTAYEKNFRLSFAPLGLLFLANVYAIVGMVGNWTGNVPGWMTDRLNSVMDWVVFALVLAFHSLLLPAVLRLAMSVDLPKTANVSSRNLILVWLWGVLYLVTRLVPAGSEAQKVFAVVLTVFDLLFILLNLFLFLSCMKNIAPEETEGEEEQPPRRHRWDLLNRLGDRFAREQEKAVETRRAETEEYLRRKKEQAEQRKNRKNKK